MTTKSIFFIGPPGSGKTTHSQLFLKHLEKHHKKVLLLNLDCSRGTFQNFNHKNHLKFIFLEEIFFELHLGPNGGVIFLFEFLEKNFCWIENIINFSFFRSPADFVLVDFPGQNELFSHNKSLKFIVERFFRLDWNPYCILLNDICFYKDPTVILTLTFVSTSIYLNLSSRILFVLTKSDLIEDELFFEDFFRSCWKFPENLKPTPFDWVLKMFYSLKYSTSYLEPFQSINFDLNTSKNYKKISKLLISI